MTMLDKAARAAGDVAATMDADVRNVLTEGAIERVVRAVLEAVRVPSEGDCQSIKCAADPDWLLDGPSAGRVVTAYFDHILNENQE